MRIAEQYVGAFEKLAKNSTTMLLPANANDAGSMVAQAMSVFETVRASRANGKELSGNPWGTKPKA